MLAGSLTLKPVSVKDMPDDIQINIFFQYKGVGNCPSFQNNNFTFIKEKHSANPFDFTLWTPKDVDATNKTIAEFIAVLEEKGSSYEVIYANESNSDNYRDQCSDKVVGEARSRDNNNPDNRPRINARLINKNDTY